MYISINVFVKFLIFLNFKKSIFNEKKIKITKNNYLEKRFREKFEFFKMYFEFSNSMKFENENNRENFQKKNF